MGPWSSGFRRSDASLLLLLALSLFGIVGCRDRRERWHYGPLRDPASTGEPGGAGAALDPIQAERMLSEYGCTACHTFYGERLIGPSLAGLEGRERRFADGTTLVVSREYLMESLYQPGRRVVEGYADVMPSYEGVVDDASAEQIAAYLLTLR